MTQNAHVPAREPVSDILSKAARLGLELLPGTLHSSARFLYAAVDETLDHLRQAEAPLRRRVAPDTTVAFDTAVTLCAEHAGERAEHTGKCMVPKTAQRVERVIVLCFAFYDAPRSHGAGAFRRPAVFCGGIRHRHRRTWPSRRETSTSAAPAATARTTLPWLAATIPSPAHPPDRQPWRSRKL